MVATVSAPGVEAGWAEIASVGVNILNSVSAVWILNMILRRLVTLSEWKFEGLIFGVGLVTPTRVATENHGSETFAQIVRDTIVAHTKAHTRSQSHEQCRFSNTLQHVWHSFSTES